MALSQPAPQLHDEDVVLPPELGMAAGEVPGAGTQAVEATRVQRRRRRLGESAQRGGPAGNDRVGHELGSQVERDHEHDARRCEGDERSEPGPSFPGRVVGVDVDGRTFWVYEGDDHITMATRTRAGEPDGMVRIQYPTGTGWTRETMLAFLASVHVGPGAQQGVG